MSWWEYQLGAGMRVLVFLILIFAIAYCTGGCATPQTYPLANHPGWTVQESAIPLTGIPDGPPEACDRVWEGQQKYGPVPPCGMTDATTDCRTKTVKLWWYARPGALDHELTHVKECK